MSLNIHMPKLKRISLSEKMKQFRMMKKQRGMTLLEIIIVLGIIGTIAAGVVVLAQRAFDSRAVSEIVSNANTIRISMKDAYQRAGAYPESTGAASGYSMENIKKPGEANEAIAKLVQLGKISVDEARNGISNDFINVGGAKTSTGENAKLKGFFLELNGLDRDQCRNIIIQVANQWDYVAVNQSAAGAYAQKEALDMSVKPVVDAASFTGILRSLNVDGNTLVTPDTVTNVCTDTASNSVILGSR